MINTADRPGRGRKIAIIFNPVAGARRHRRLDRLVSVLDARGWHVTVMGTNGPGDATVLAAEAVAAGTDVIAAAGGDGTINEVVRGMHGSGIPLGIVPMGTANVLAAEFRLPKQPEEIARIFADATPRRLHLPRVNGAPFLLMVGAGFDGRVVAMVTPPLKRRYGKGAFLGQGVRALIAATASTMTVEVDGVAHSAAWAVVTNISRYGGPYRIAPGADPGEASLTAVLFRSGVRLALMNHLLRIGSGRLAAGPSVSVLPAQTVRIVDTPGIVTPVQIDGDAAGVLPVEITASEEFVDILAPPA